MPNVRAEGHRLRAGTYTSSSVTTTYAITAWTVQSDQQLNGQTVSPWIPPYQAPPPEYARVITTGDLNQGADGYLKWTWTFSYWTFGQMSYFLSTYLSGSVYSAAVTAMTYDATDTAVFINATLNRPVINQDMEPEIAGWKNVKLRFDSGVVTS